jgi:hypothetical protein
MMAQWKASSAVEGFERSDRWVDDRPRSARQRQQYLKGTGVPAAPFIKGRRLSVTLTEQPIVAP